MRKHLVRFFMLISTIGLLTGCFNVKVPYYTVEFYAQDQLIKSEVVKRSHFATYPDAPEVRGYSFEGWDRERLPVRSDLKVNALYELIHYQITYVNYGEPVDNPNTYTVLDEIVFNNPTTGDFVFLGWFLDGVKVEKIEKGTIGDLTLVAVYDEVNYMVREDKEALIDDYKDILSGNVEALDALPLVGTVYQSKITWQSNSTGVYVNPFTGEVTITKGEQIQEIILYAIIEKDNYVELCEFRFNILSN